MGTDEASWKYPVYFVNIFADACDIFLVSFTVTYFRDLMFLVMLVMFIM